MTQDLKEKVRIEIFKLGIGGIVMAAVIIFQRIDYKAEIKQSRDESKKENNLIKTDLRQANSKLDQFILNEFRKNITVIERNNEFLASLKDR